MDDPFIIFELGEKITTSCSSLKGLFKGWELQISQTNKFWKESIDQLPELRDRQIRSWSAHPEELRRCLPLRNRVSDLSRNSREANSERSASESVEVDAEEAADPGRWQLDDHLLRRIELIPEKCLINLLSS